VTRGRRVQSHAADRKTHKVLSKFGAYVRRRSQTSMKSGGEYPSKAEPDSPGKRGRKRKEFTVSRPGQPPRTHGKRLLRKLIEFAYDPAKKTVVIGPYRLGRTAAQHVPRTHEVGGVIRLKKKDGTTKTGHYRPRPYMKPAFDREIVWVAEEYRKA
jgi:hypothetical protein